MLRPKVYPGIKVWGPVFSSYRASFFIAWVSVSLPTGKDRLCFPVLWQAGIQKGEIERTASRESGRGPRSGTQAGPRQRSDSTCWRPRGGKRGAQRRATFPGVGPTRSSCSLVASQQQKRRSPLGLRIPKACTPRERSCGERDPILHTPTHCCCC